MHSPISDLTYDWLTVLHTKAKAIKEYEQFLQDAQREGSQECIDLLSRLREQDVRMLEDVSRHVAEHFGKDFAALVENRRKALEQQQVSEPRH